MQCADVPDMSNTVRSDELSNVVFRAVQAWVQHGQDGPRQQGLDSEMQVERNILSSTRVSEQ